MKKILVTGAILSLLSASVFAQEAAPAAAGQTGTAAATDATAGTSTGGFFSQPAFAGLSVGAATAIGVAVAAVAVAASDDDDSSTTHHSTATHH